MAADDRRNGDSTNHNRRDPKKPRLSEFLTESDIRSEFAHHHTGVARVNNGSFGCCPSSVLDAQREWQLRFLRQPDEFYFNGLRRGLLASRTVISDLINADDVDEVSLVDNATTAAAIVLQRVGRCFSEGRYQKEDTVVMFHCAFQSVKKSIQAYVTRVGGSTVEVRLPFPVSSNDEIVSAFREGLKKGRANGRTVRLAIIDHITSMPCVLMPVRELVKVCREEGVEEVFVDAAHAIGSVKVDVKEIGADYYVSNLHKWFFCPPSIAFFYCKKRGSELDVHHPVVSHEFGNGLAIESAWIGTRDYSSQLVVPSVMEFVSRFEGGIDGIMERNHDEAVKMGLMLCNAWGTNLGSPPEMCVGMVMIGLPSKLCVESDEDAVKLRSYLRVHRSVEVPVYFLGLRDGEEGVKDKDSGVITAYVRISRQVYNETEDYERLRDAITELVKDQRTCQNLPPFDIFRCNNKALEEEEPEPLAKVPEVTLLLMSLWWSGVQWKKRLTLRRLFNVFLTTEKPIRLLNFVSEEQLEESKKERGERVEDGTFQRDRALYEILKENKDKKDAEFNERFKHRPPKALDEDETEFLDKLEMSKKEYEQQLADEDEQQIRSFQAAVAARSATPQEPEEAALPPPAPPTKEPKTTGKRNSATRPFNTIIRVKPQPKKLKATEEEKKEISGPPEPLQTGLALVSYSDESEDDD
ncbi:hypothetical protein IGI04_027721 [Brassica rapa subsp. trilocularis]|uniref:Aminotransferase class V domain-containing protein n=1 Tax=Brassica rapa subsp. trilocularis TaxID=1813537 RepID=A0ABQ7KZU4_BRACM|nr:hypothetical protein IGI04_027721 [Brassica rapa subsp. trilocularis]